MEITDLTWKSFCIVKSDHKTDPSEKICLVGWLVLLQSIQLRYMFGSMTTHRQTTGRQTTDRQKLTDKT